MSEYIPDPSMLDIPIKTVEIEEYIDNPDLFIKDRRKVHHLLRRVQVTMNGYREQIQNLTREIQDIRVASRKSGAATTMTPRDALRYVSPDELRALVDSVSAAVLDEALAKQRQADDDLRHLNTEKAKLKVLAAELFESGRIDETTRNSILAAVEPPVEQHAAQNSWAGQRDPEPTPKNTVSDLTELFS